MVSRSERVEKRLFSLLFINKLLETRVVHSLWIDSQCCTLRMLFLMPSNGMRNTQRHKNSGRQTSAGLFFFCAVGRIPNKLNVMPMQFNFIGCDGFSDEIYMRQQEHLDMGHRFRKNVTYDKIWRRIHPPQLDCQDSE